MSIKIAFCNERLTETEQVLAGEEYLDMELHDVIVLEDMFLAYSLAIKFT